MIFTLFIHVHKFPIKHMCWHSITKIHRNGPRAHFPFTSAEDLPGAFEHIEGEINDLDEVIARHGDFCALAASRGTSVAFLKSGCEHGKIVNIPNFSLSPADLDNVPNLARSIANRFIKLVWTNGGRSKAGDEARSHLKLVTKSYLMLTFSF